MGDAVAHKKGPRFHSRAYIIMVLWEGSCIFGFLQACEMGRVGFCTKNISVELHLLICDQLD